MINYIVLESFLSTCYIRHQSHILFVLTSKSHSNLTKQILHLGHFRDDEIEAKSLRNFPMVHSLHLASWDLNSVSLAPVSKILIIISILLTQKIWGSTPHDLLLSGPSHLHSSGNACVPGSFLSWGQVQERKTGVQLIAAILIFTTLLSIQLINELLFLLRGWLQSA